LAAESAVALAQVPLDAAAEELAAEFAEAPDAQSAAVLDAGPAVAAEQRALEVAEAQPDAAAVAEEPRDVVAEEAVLRAVEAAAEVQHAAEEVEAEPRVAAAVAVVSVQPSAAAHLDLRPARSRMTKVTQTFQHVRQVAKPEALRSLSSSEVSTEGVSWRPVCLK